MICNISDLIFQSSEKFKNKPFIRYLDSNKYISFLKLEKLKSSMNIFLKSLKIYKNNKIVVLMDNSPLLVLLFLIIPGSKRIFIPLNPNAGLEEIKYIINSTKPKLLIINKEFIFKIGKIKIKKIIISKDFHFINQILNSKEKIKNKKKRKEKFKNTIAQILFTSGSTGNPKGVRISHKNIITNLIGLVERLKFKKKNSRFLSITPLYHNNGQFIPTLCPLILGGETFSIPPIQSLNNFFQIIEKNKINYTSAMATHINYLNKFQKKKSSKYLKFICVGGAKLDEQNHKFFEKKFKIRVLCNYGLTETTSVTSSEGVSKKMTKIGSVGKPLFNNKILIKKEKGEKFGEILIEGENVFKNYHNNKFETRKKIKKKYLHTGDLGYFDRKKFLYIVDRIDNMINISGENIYPYEIERYTNNFKNISLSVAIPITNIITQNSIVLIYETTDNKKIDLDILKKYLSTKISKFKIPKYYFNVNEIGLSEIPKAPNKKILRKKIQIYFKDFIKKSRIDL
jgi:acyl-CoA synthetase (AMP-forming)/AMP-acid ligase II